MLAQLTIYIIHQVINMQLSCVAAMRVQQTDVRGIAHIALFVGSLAFSIREVGWLVLCASVEFCRRRWKVMTSAVWIHLPPSNFYFWNFFSSFFILISSLGSVCARRERHMKPKNRGCCACLHVFAPHSRFVLVSRRFRRLNVCPKNC